MSGIGSNKSDVKVVSAGAKWTGVANMMVISINQSMDELKAAGLNPTKEPEYITEETAPERGMAPAVSFKKLRLDFALFHPTNKFYNKLAIWLESRVRYNLKGDKVEWINKFGNTAWSSSIDTPASSIYNWFKSDMERPALNGEGTLAMFIKNWANCGPEDQAIFDDPLALINGDYSQAKNLLRDIAKNEVQVLNGVKKSEKDQKYYQVVYGKYFDRPYNRDYTRWAKELNGEYGKFDADYQNSLELKEYVGKVTMEEDTPTNFSPTPSESKGHNFNF